MPTSHNIRRTIHITDSSPDRLPVWVWFEGGSRGSENAGPPTDCHPVGNLDQAYYACGTSMTQIDADKLLKRYQAERTATVEDCDQAIYSLSSAVDFFWEIMTRKSGPEMLRVRLRALAEIEEDLCRAMTELSSIPVQQEAAE